MKVVALGLLLATALSGCSSHSRKDYDDALDCLAVTADFYALSSASKTVGLDKSSDGPEFAMGLVNRWKSKVLVAGGAAGKSQSQINADMLARINRGSEDLSKALERNYNKAVDESARKNVACTKRL